jgi:phospholipase A1
VDTLRLACYDRALGRKQPHGETARTVQQESMTPPPSASVATAPEPARPDTRNPDLKLFRREHEALQSRQARVDGTSTSPRPSLLDSRWELSPDSKLGTFGIRGYKPVYLLPVFHMNRVYDTPHSPSPGHNLDTSLQLKHTETKFQLSLKTKVWQGVIGNHGDLWLAYTQSSHWQVYNSLKSRPFRETNYEPEAMLVFNTNYHVLGWNGRLLGIGLNHQSNGRSNPLSRSWNRVIADIGLERGPWTIMIRPWWRVPEKRLKDDNPDISDYMGRGEVQVVREWGANEFTLMGRHSLRKGSHSHGAMRFTWAFPIHSSLRGYFQIFNGYGESLIDYNHHATYVGLGISLLGWY